MRTFRFYKDSTPLTSPLRHPRLATEQIAKLPIIQSVRRLVHLLVALGSPWVSVAAPAADYTRLAPEKFGALPRLAERIELGNYDRALLAAAIFHETNRVRRAHDRKPLRFDPRLDEAADLQAGMAAMSGQYDHSNPLLGRETVSARARESGLPDGLVAENVASTPLLEIDEERGVNIQRNGEERLFRDVVTGKPLPARTYGDLARVVVRQWMDSPRHRANILNRDLRYLGCSVRHAKNPQGLDLLISVQVFHSAAGGLSNH
jgi:uncharacterized protein YkwD